MYDEPTLPTSPYINTTIGLKYLNGNKKLYLKVLNSFLTRYQDFDIYALQEDELKSGLHTLKGLSATLGMEKLTTLSEQLQEEPDQKSLKAFSEILNLIMQDLQK